MDFKKLYQKEKGKTDFESIEYIDYLEQRLNSIRDIAIKSNNSTDSIYAIILLTEN